MANLFTGGGINWDTLSDDDLTAMESRFNLAPITAAPETEGPSSNITLSPEIQNLVNQTYEAQRQTGAENLRREAIEASTGRGLNFSDTPISDPYMRALAQLESQIASQRAGSILNLLQQNRELGERARQFNVGQELNRFTFNENVRQFQEELRQRAFQNRLALGQQFGATGLGLASARLGRGTGQTTTSPQNAAIGFNLLSGAGAQLGRSVDVLSGRQPQQPQIIMIPGLGLGMSQTGFLG